MTSCRQLKFEQCTITERAPFSRMLPKLMGVIGDCMGRDYHRRAGHKDLKLGTWPEKSRRLPSESLTMKVLAPHGSFLSV